MENQTVTRAITPVNQTSRKIDAIRSYGNAPANLAQFANLVGKDAPGYIGSALLAVQMSSDLLACTPESIFSAALRAASVKLSCDPSLGHAYLIPFKRNGVAQAELIIGYKGLYQIALRSNTYKTVNISIIYEGQNVETDYVTGDIKVTGRPMKLIRIGILGYFQLVDGYSKGIYMTTKEIHDHAKKYSRGYEKKDGVWKTNPEAMEKKTVLRLLLTRWGYLDPMVNRLLMSEGDPGEEIETCIENAEALDGEAIDVTSLPKAEFKQIEFDEDWEESYLKSVVRPEIIMDLDEAKAYKDVKGNTYGEKTIAQLANFLPKIDKAILEASDVEVRQSLEMRRNAILTILNAEKEARGLDLKMEKFF